MDQPCVTSGFSRRMKRDGDSCDRLCSRVTVSFGTNCRPCLLSISRAQAAPSPLLSHNLAHAALCSAQVQSKSTVRAVVASIIQQSLPPSSDKVVSGVVKEFSSSGTRPAWIIGRIDSFQRQSPSIYCSIELLYLDHGFPSKPSILLQKRTQNQSTPPTISSLAHIYGFSKPWLLEIQAKKRWQEFVVVLDSGVSVSASPQAFARRSSIAPTTAAAKSSWNETNRNRTSSVMVARNRGLNWMNGHLSISTQSTSRVWMTSAALSIAVVPYARRRHDLIERRHC
ncbi:hypothetical protein IWZ00DRAFT_326428 [Phyllosticta capitalensis]|uniref:Uncharacterized protein n=1 Tax=Phyllosticta capitalensis TaxID=121624 RepID=A0ABR1YH11_9PEZI